MDRATKLARAKTYTDRRAWTIRLLNGIANPIGVEIGVFKADYGKLMLDAIPDLTWYSVDPYAMYGVDDYWTNGLKFHSQETWDAVFLRVTVKMSKFGSRSVLIRKTSEEAINFIPEGVDFIFLDGIHHYEFVQMELPLYEKKLKKGGIMSGHDYDTPSTSKAIGEYLQENNRELILETFDPLGVWWWRV